MPIKGESKKNTSCDEKVVYYDYDSGYAHLYNVIKNIQNYTYI